MKITVSIGIATIEANAEFLPQSGEDLIAAADNALYAAKKAGRDQVVSADNMAHQAACA